MCSLLSLLAFSVLSSNKTELRLAENALEQAKARAMADAGINLAVHRLLTQREDRGWQDGALTARMTLDDGDVRYSIRDEDSKIDINAASNELLMGLFLASGTSRKEAQRLVGRISDFRGPKDPAGDATATDGSIRSMDRPPSNEYRPFVDISELSTIIGMNDRVFERVRPHVTVFADVNGFDPNYASETTLRALPGMTPALAAKMTAKHDTNHLAHALAEGEVDIPEHYVIPSRRTIFSIRSVGETAKSGRFFRDVTVALDGGARRLPFSIFLWSKGRTPMNGI